MPYSCQQLIEKLSSLIQEGLGPLDTQVDGVSSIEVIEPKSLVFVSKADLLEQALKSQAGAVVTQARWISNEIRKNPPKPLLLTQNVGLAQARLTEILVGRPPLDHTGKIHPTAVVATSAKIGEGTSVGPYAVIGENARVGDRVYIGAHTVIDHEAEVGSDTTLWPQVYIGAQCRVGQKAVIYPHTSIGSEGFGFAHDEKGHHYRIPQTGIVVIEDRVEIGSHCTIDRATFAETRIGSGTVMDNHCHVVHNCAIGKNCVITGGLVMGGSSRIGDGCLLGGNVTITDHVTIAAGTQLGGLSAVSKDIPVKGSYGGYPLQPIKDYLKTTASLIHIPRMRREIAKILNHLGLSEE